MAVNFFKKYGYNNSDVDKKLSLAWATIFYGNKDEESVFCDLGSQAFINSVDSSDIRSEGMSYGMMICVLMDKKSEFNKLWTFAKEHMQHQDGDRKYYFSWQLKNEAPYDIIDPNPAPDGEEYFVTSLLWAARKWGNGEGIFNYQKEADLVLHEMIHKNYNSSQFPMWNSQHHQVVFTTDLTATQMTDPSYHLPAFYELWAKWTNNEADKEYWLESARVSRIFFTRALHPRTGLSPNYSNFDGTPFAATWVADHDYFGYDAFRTIMNISMDYAWNKKDPSQIKIAENLLHFFSSRGTVVCQYTLEGVPLEHCDPVSEALISMNATAIMATENRELAQPFVDQLWNLKVPTGLYRYYNSMLYFLAMLNLSGKFNPDTLE